MSTQKLIPVYIFKNSGKWKFTVYIDMSEAYDAEDLHETVNSLIIHAHGGTPRECYAICTDPYHQFSHPIMIKYL